MKKGLSALLLAGMLTMGATGCGQIAKETVNEYNVVPLPNRMIPQAGLFRLTNGVPVITADCSPEVQAIADSMITRIRAISGIKLKNGAQAASGTPSIRFVIVANLPQ